MLLIILVFLMFGCSKQEVEASNLSTDYLSILNVNKSTIEKIDYNKIAQYYSKLPIRDFAYISQNIDEVLETDYTMKPIKNRLLETGDIIQYNLEIFDKNNNIIHTEENVRILYGYGYLGEDIEKSLLKTIPNKSLTFNINDEISRMYGLKNDAQYLKLNITEIYSYTEKEETAKILSEQGFSNFKEFYDYLFHMKVSEHDYEKTTDLKDSFIKYAVDCCEFNISDEDLKSYSLQVVKEHRQTAESLNMNLEDYYTDILSLEQDDFFIMCTESAEMEIKKCLIIGALAQYNNIEISENDFYIFCEKNNVDMSDSIIVCAAKYYCLEKAVFEHYIGLY